MSGSPERIGKYRVLELLGRGGMGSVYRAHDPQLDRPVAIKVMTEGTELGTEARERFFREAQSAARLNHPNIITVYELGEDQGQVFIVMELLEGNPLSRLVAQDPPLPLRKRLALMVQICDGLAYAHRRGVIHRDIKPANIFVLADGQVKILDFGIARVASSELTRTGLLMGTPSYMSPEQTRGRRTDHRSDIFSVGVVFYELLSGRKPFEGEDYFETMEKVRSEDPPPLAEMAPDLPPLLVRSVHRTLVKDPTARYQSLDELRADLAAVPEMLPAEVTPENLREAVDRKFAEVARLHRSLVSALGAAALGDETLPLADGSASGASLETLLRDLETRTDRLRTLSRTVDRLDSTVTRGITAFERGAFEEAADALYAVLQELPQHQRARDYYDRVRIEMLRERTMRTFAPERPPEAGPPPTPSGVGSPAGSGTPVGQTAAGQPEASRSRVAAVATPPGRPVTPTPALPPVRPARTPPPEAAGEVSGAQAPAAPGRRRFGLAVGGLVTIAVLGGASVLFVRTWSVPVAPPATPVLPPKPVPPKSTPPPTVGKPPVPATSSRPAPGPATSAPGPTARPTPAPAPVPSSTPAPAKPEAIRPATPAGSPPALTPEQAKTLEDAMTLAQLFEARGDHERALREYQRALAVDPRNAEARAGVAAAEAAVKGKR